jgi:hypothetical protein
MSDALAPCLLCHTDTAIVQHQETPSIFSTEAGYWVHCTACGLRGPWRVTEAGARQVWNRAVTIEAETPVEQSIC